MPTTPAANQTVRLNVSTARSPLPASWTLCQNNHTYMYNYTGGNPTSNQPAGSVNFTHGSGTKYVDIALVASSGFAISKVQITYGQTDGAKDLTAAEKADDPGVWRITNTNIDAEYGTFEVSVDDSNVEPNVTNIECDPRWVNN